MINELGREEEKVKKRLLGDNCYLASHPDRQIQKCVKASCLLLSTNISLSWYFFLLSSQCLVEERMNSNHRLGKLNRESGCSEECYFQCKELLPLFKEAKFLALKLGVML